MAERKHGFESMSVEKRRAAAKQGGKVSGEKRRLYAKPKATKRGRRKK